MDYAAVRSEPSDRLRITADTASSAVCGAPHTAQFERALIQERVQAGLVAARRRGRRGGRPVAIDAEKLRAMIAALDGGASKAAVCRTFGVRRTTRIDSLARIGWSAGLKEVGGTSGATAAAERNPDRGAVRAADDAA